MSYRLRAGFCAAVVFASAAAAPAQVDFQALPNTQDWEHWNVFVATPDLSVMAGRVAPPLTTPRGGRWTSSGQAEMLPLAAGTFSARATGISGDGQIVSGWGSRNGGESTAFRWTAQTGTVPLGTTPGYTSARAYAVSLDGAVIGGTQSGADLGGRAVLWRDDGLVEIPLPQGYLNGWVSTINGDGSAAAGHYFAADSSYLAYRWTAAGGVETIDTPPGTVVQPGARLSNDGEMMLGLVGGSGGSSVFRWTPQGGTQLLDTIPMLPDLRASSPEAMVLVGSYRPDGVTYRPFYWSEAGGFLDVAEFLSSNGVDLTGWDLVLAGAVSADGRTIAGDGYFTDASGVRRAHVWTATIPAPPGVFIGAAILAILGRRLRGTLSSSSFGDGAPAALRAASVICSGAVARES